MTSSEKQTGRSRFLQRQQKALAVAEERLKAELPVVLGMSALATSLQLAGQPPRQHKRRGSEAAAALASTGDATPTQRGSVFHLMVAYRHQHCGDCFGSVSLDGKQILITHAAGDPAIHDRAEWLTWFSAIRFAESYGSLLDASGILILRPAHRMYSLLNCLGFDLSTMQVIAPDAGKAGIMLDRLAEEQSAATPLPEHSFLASSSLEPGRTSTGKPADGHLSPLSPYQLKAIRSVIGIDGPKAVRH
jgi:hypothetical protein